MTAKKKLSLSSATRWPLAISFIVMLTLNGLAGSSTLLGGVNTAAVSDRFQNLFTPAGFTFAIWGIIYLLLPLFVLYVFGVGRRKKSSISDQTLAKIARLATINFALNATWILAWQYQVLWLSVLLIVAILATLGMIVSVLRTIDIKGGEYLQVQLPFSIYFGWITVATVANIATWLVSVRWDGLGIADATWMIVITLVAAAIGIATALRNHDAAYLSVFVWAFFGIYSRHTAAAKGYDGAYPEVISTLIVVLITLSAVVGWLLIKTKRTAQGRK